MDYSRLDQATRQSIVERCLPLVADVEETDPRLPVRILADESWVVADVLDDHFEPRQLSSRSIPGLRALQEGGQLPRNLAAELREFGVAVMKVQWDYRTLIEQQKSSPVPRAEHLASEFRAALSFLLEGGDHPEEEEVLDRIRDDFESPSSQSVLAAILEGYVAVAARHQEALTALSGFDEGNLDEALRVAAELRQYMADRVSGEDETRAKELLSRRNLLITGLTERLRIARRAVRYAFRDYPEIVRKVSSEYERDRRRANKRRQAALESGVPESADGPVTTEDTVAAS